MRILTSIAVLALFTGPAAAQIVSPIEPRHDGVVRAPVAEDFRTLSVSDLEDAEVENLDGTDLGEVERVVRGPTGEVFAVLEFGGFLGLGESKRLVPLSRLSWRDGELVYPGKTKAELEELSPWRDTMAGFLQIDEDQRVRVLRSTVD
jgi:hypothetical protein